MMKTHTHKTASSGFTLVEMLITIAIATIMATIGVPGVRDFFDKEELLGATEQLYSHLQLARVESIKRSVPIYVNFSASGSPWDYGFSHRNACDATQSDPTGANACVLVVDNGNGLVDTGDGLTDAADLMLMRFSNTQHAGISASVEDGSLELRFDPVRGTASSTVLNKKKEIDLVSAQGRKLRLSVGPLGKIDICTPDGSMGNYKDC